MTALAASEAYRLWAPTYERENVVTTLECALLEQLSPPPDLAFPMHALIVLQPLPHSPHFFGHLVCAAPRHRQENDQRRAESLENLQRCDARRHGSTLVEILLDALRLAHQPHTTQKKRQTEDSQGYGADEDAARDQPFVRASLRRL